MQKREEVHSIHKAKPKKLGTFFFFSQLQEWQLIKNVATYSVAHCAQLGSRVSFVDWPFVNLSTDFSCLTIGNPKNAQ